MNSTKKKTIIALLVAGGLILGIRAINTPPKQKKEETSCEPLFV